MGPEAESPTPSEPSLSSGHHIHSPPTANNPFALIIMSDTHPPAASSSSNFQTLFNNALDTYKERTKNDLRDHPLAKQLQDCQSPDAILDVLKQQLDQSRSTDERWTKWLDPTIHVLFTFSQAVGTVGLVREPFIRDFRSHIYLAGIHTHDHYFCRSRSAPFSMYPK